MLTDGDGRVVAGATKGDLRRAALAARRGMSASARSAAAEQLSRTVIARADGARLVAAYVPFGTEPGDTALLDALSARATVIVPVVRGDGDLDWAAWTGADDLAPSGPSGRMLRPIGPTLGAAFLAEADLVLVPALLVARTGARLGRGGGSYDRALPRVRPGVPVAALLFDGELVDQLPADPHDVAVAAAITPIGGWTDLPI